MEADIDSPNRLRRRTARLSLRHVSRCRRGLAQPRLAGPLHGASMSFAYGAFFSVTAWIVLFVLSLLEATVSSCAGGRLLLVAPLLAAGLYEIEPWSRKGRADHRARGL